MNLSNAERTVLNTLSKFHNIPRKKAKFLNFIKFMVNNRTVTMSVVESTWNKMEAAYKQSQQTKFQESDNRKYLLIVLQ